ncbi:hypothetical protein BDV95DRAFT_569088 [Massariosphaeria phaeospora]|uniref:Uncharacterized protein n=1 Tax=Massariosphaeria phaeospora TaxID=100035 RepID=A0A7C8M7Z4_9PLEO|nr:hypothetical protein BDV95DRAFT_569088 [Massariosphaeria phaeospora]
MSSNRNISLEIRGTTLYFLIGVSPLFSTLGQVTTLLGTYLSTPGISHPNSHCIKKQAQVSEHFLCQLGNVSSRARTGTLGLSPHHLILTSGKSPLLPVWLDAVLCTCILRGSRTITVPVAHARPLCSVHHRLEICRFCHCFSHSGLALAA